MLTSCLRFHTDRVTMALRIVTSYYEHFTCSYEYCTDDTLRFSGFIYFS